MSTPARCSDNLAKYNVPERLELLDALPKTSVNKTDKRALTLRAAIP